MTSYLFDSSLENYRQYLTQSIAETNMNFFQRLTTDIQDTEWEEPKSARDLNNFAVMALIEAESAQDLSLRAFHLEMAIEALNRGVEQRDYPLCAAHLALVQSMIGKERTAIQVAFSNFIEINQLVFNASTIPLGLIYLPSKQENSSTACAEKLQRILQAGNGYEQALILLTEVLCRSQLVFYSLSGLRFLQLAATLLPNSAAINLQLGLSSLMNQHWEGLFYLQRARKLAPHCAPAIQALYLTYRELRQFDAAKFWLNTARKFHHQHPQSLDWCWANLPLDSSFTYLTFEDSLLLAVEPSFKSIVTSVLLAQGDWFEKEIEYWRNQLQPGMTVIDVGANVGVYTFSAAKKVGAAGRVLAVEPFSGCVSCLEETCRVNNLSWVKVCGGAASDRNGTIRLAIHAASELNEVISDDSAALSLGNTKDVNCFTLDSLIEQEELKRVDWLKIDAEGHEMQVLAGSDRLLTEFTPGILYENVAGTKGSNTSVAQFLWSKGYQLFRYIPFLQELMLISTIDDLQGNLNIIALPPDQANQANLSLQ